MAAVSGSLTRQQPRIRALFSTVPHSAGALETTESRTDTCDGNEEFCPTLVHNKKWTTTYFSDGFRLKPVLELSRTKINILSATNSSTRNSVCAGSLYQYVLVLCISMRWFSVLLCAGSLYQYALVLCISMCWFSVLVCAGSLYQYVLVLCISMCWVSVLVRAGSLYQYVLVLCIGMCWFSVLTFPKQISECMH